MAQVLRDLRCIHMSAQPSFAPRPILDLELPPQGCFPGVRTPLGTTSCAFGYGVLTTKDGKSCKNIQKSRPLADAVQSPSRSDQQAISPVDPAVIQLGMLDSAESEVYAFALDRQVWGESYCRGGKGCSEAKAPFVLGWSVRLPQSTRAE